MNRGEDHGAEQCGACRFWEEFWSKDDIDHAVEVKDTNHSKAPTGWCKRFPPQLIGTDPEIVRYGENGKSDMGDAECFPTTGETEWCGEFRRAIESLPAEGGEECECGHRRSMHEDAVVPSSPTLGNYTACGRCNCGGYRVAKAKSAGGDSTKYFADTWQHCETGRLLELPMGTPAPGGYTKIAATTINPVAVSRANEEAAPQPAERGRGVEEADPFQKMDVESCLSWLVEATISFAFAKDGSELEDHEDERRHKATAALRAAIAADRREACERAVDLTTSEADLGFYGTKERDAIVARALAKENSRPVEKPPGV